MPAKKLHKTLGLILLLPLLGWLTTGLVFLIQPGYNNAYEQVSPKLYALEQTIEITPQINWLESRVLRTVLGVHLLVKTDHGWQQLNPTSLQPAPQPNQQQLTALLNNAIAFNQERYGVIEHHQNGSFITSTGVYLNLDWNTLSIRQSGNDTKLINTLYKIHYLQWLGHKQANLALGVLGLLCLFGLVYFGVVLYFRRRV